MCEGPSRCKMSLHRRSMVLVNAVSLKQKCSFGTGLKYVEQPFPCAQIVGATLREMRVGKRTRGRGRGQCLFFPTHSCQEGQLLAYNSRPTETINTKVSGNLNVVFYMLNLFQIRFLVDKVKKNKHKKSHLQDHKDFFY